MKLTAIVLVGKNNQVEAKRAIESVSFANEVIVVKEELPIKDFSKIRNESLSKAKEEWVLFVDSDEVVSEKLRNEILYRFRIESGMTGYKLKRQDRFLGKWLRYGETAGVRLLRLAKKGAGRWERPVHEVWKINGRVGEFKNAILHYSHDSIGGLVEKLDRYSEIEAEWRLGKLGKLGILIEMILFPSGKFIHNYIFRLGFLDGMEGFIHAGMMSGHSFLVRGKVLARVQESTKR